MQYEDTVRIATPEGVELELPLAGIGSRLAARCIDVLIQGTVVVIALVIYANGARRVVSGEALVAIIGILIGFVIFWLYDVRSRRSAAAAHLASEPSGIRVVGEAGEPIGSPPPPCGTS